MSKKIFLMLGLFITLVFTFSITTSFAEDGNGAMNMVNNAANGVRDAVGNTNNSGYTANRTATTRAATTTNGGNTFLGMNSTMWTWLILAAVAVVIIALVWYYSNQVTNNRHYDDNE